MEAKATAKYIRVSPRKMKFICDMVRGKELEEALAILKFSPQKGARELRKVVASASANAENNFGMNKDKLYIAKVNADQGPTLKRFRPRAQGRAFQILKRTSHINVVVKEKE